MMKAKIARAYVHKTTKTKSLTSWRGSGKSERPMWAGSAHRSSPNRRPSLAKLKCLED